MATATDSHLETAVEPVPAEEGLRAPAGPIASEIRKMLLRQVDESGIVVWLDPESHYEGLVADVEIPETTVACFDGSFFDLRHRVRTLMEGDGAPRLVLYVPMDEEATHHALVEFTASGAVMKPGAPSSLCNTRLSVVAKRALTGAVDAERLAEMVRHVEEGKLGLESLDKAGTRKAPLLLTEIFGAPDEDGIILEFVSSDALDGMLAGRGAIDSLADLLSRTLGIEVTATVEPGDLRSLTQRYLLLSELGSMLPSGLPRALESAPHATHETQRVSSSNIVKRWRDIHALRDSYIAAAETVERDLGIRQALDQLATGDLQGCATFPAVDRILQARTEVILAQRPAGDNLSVLPSLISLRAGILWSRMPERYPDIGPVWDLLASIAGVFIEAARPAPPAVSNPEDLAREYAKPDGWYRLDAAQRRMEERWHLLDLEGLDERPALREAVAQARRRHTDVAGERAEVFVRSFAAARFEMPGVPRQRQTWRKKVEPALKIGKTGYVLVDALRYELGAELAATLEAEVGQVDLEAAVATFPTVTPVGMASLLPGAEGDFAVAPAGASKLGVELEGSRLVSREDRLGFIQERCSNVATAWIDDLLPHPKTALDKRLKAAQLIVVTSREIDQLCESGMTRVARQSVSALLRDLARLVKKLASYGCQTIVIASDHGYLFGEEAGSDMRIAPPKGDTVDLDRRMWLGRGGAKSDDYLRAPLTATGVRGDFDICVPWGLGIFDSPGAGDEYFHGGMSPQECILPILTVHPERTPETSTSMGIAWELTMASKRITTLFCTVSAGGLETGLFELEPQRVRIEVVDSGNAIGRAVAAQYGFDGPTGDVILKPSASDPRRLDTNIVTLQLDGRLSSAEVKIRMLDVATGRELKELTGIHVEMLNL